MRAVSAVVSVLYNRPTSEADKYAPWRAAVESSLDHALRSSSPHSRAFLKNVVAAWDSLGLRGDGGKKGLRRIWEKITTPLPDTKRYVWMWKLHLLLHTCPLTVTPLGQGEKCHCNQMAPCCVTVSRHFFTIRKAILDIRKVSL